MINNPLLRLVVFISLTIASFYYVIFDLHIIIILANLLIFLILLSHSLHNELIMFSKD